VEYNIAGYYPCGGGSLKLDVEGVGTALEGFDLVERGKLNSLRAYIATSELPDHVAKRGADALRNAMKGVGRSIHIEVRERPSPGPGAAVILAAECEGGFAGFTGLGARGKPMEKVADEPCRDFMKWWKTGAAVDEHLADQLVLAACLARGVSQWHVAEVSEHLRTALWVAEQLTGTPHEIISMPDGGHRIKVLRS
jgi:RNA 3'-terminal phosphate cyclase (ATP)